MKAASEREVSGRVSWLRDVAGQQVPISPLTTQGFSHVFARCMAGIEPAPSNFTYQLSGNASVSGILLDLDIQLCCSQLRAIMLERTGYCFHLTCVQPHTVDL